MKYNRQYKNCKHQENIVKRNIRGNHVFCIFVQFLAICKQRNKNIYRITNHVERKHHDKCTLVINQRHCKHGRYKYTNANQRYVNSGQFVISHLFYAHFYFRLTGQGL